MADVTITINRDVYTNNSVGGTISVISNTTPATFNGYTLEDKYAGPLGNKPPIPQGSYGAFVRTDHNPDRIELQNVPGYSNIQIHVGNTADDVMGCFAVGNTRATDFVGGSNPGMNSILNIIQQDGSGNITVKVNGHN